MNKKKADKVDIEEAYKMYKAEKGEEIENIEIPKSFIRKTFESLEEKADAKRKLRQEQNHGNADKKIQKMKLECDAIEKRRKDLPNYILTKSERKSLLKYSELQRKSALKKQQEEKKELERKAKRMKRRRKAFSAVPKSVQEAIPFIADYEEGVFELEDGWYSKSLELQDINYQVSKEEEQISIFCKYGEFLNYFSEDMLLNITIINKRINKETQADSVTFKLRGDEHDNHRKEYNKILLRQIATGKNDIVQKKYVTISLKANNPFEAILKFHKVQNEVMSNLKKIGSGGRILNTEERLELLHDLLRSGDEGRFSIDFDFIKKQGISSKDYIAPSDIYFDRDYMTIDNTYCKVMFLNNLPKSITDNFLAELSDTEFPCIINQMIRPIEQAKGVKIVNKQVTGMEKDKMEAEKVAFRSGYSPETISHNLKQSLYEGKELLDDMTNKNQKMFLTALTVMVYGETKELLEQNCTSLKNIVRKYTCRLQELNYLQEEGFKQTLPIGNNLLEVNRTLTTESLAIFIPFTSNELFEPGGFYYGINQITKNAIFCDRKKMKVPHGWCLGSSGSGKSFKCKQEMLNVILNMGAEESDLLVIDPDNEYLGFLKSFGAEIINISASSKNYINPLDLSLNYSDGDSDPLALKSNYILSIVEAMMSVGSRHETIITPQQRTLVDRALRKTYKELIDHNFDSNYTPSLMDFQKELDFEKERSEDGRLVAEAVEYYTKGSMNIFSHHTNVNLGKRIIVFNTRDLGAQLKEIGLLIILDYIWNRMVQNKSDKKLTYLYIDEIHTLFKNEFSAEFIKQLFKRGRKYGLIITAITQNVEEVLRNEEARTMIGNSKYISMLDQASSDLLILADMLHLSETQMGYVTNSDEGCGLLFAENVIVPFQDQFPGDSYLYKLMSTKFGEDTGIEYKDIESHVYDDKADADFESSFSALSPFDSEQSLICDQEMLNIYKEQSDIFITASEDYQNDQSSNTAESGMLPDYVINQGVEEDSSDINESEEIYNHEEIKEQTDSVVRGDIPEQTDIEEIENEAEADSEKIHEINDEVNNLISKIKAMDMSEEAKEALEEKLLIKLLAKYS